MGAGGDGAAWVPGPLRPRTRVQGGRRGVAGDFEGEDHRASGNTGSAVSADQAIGGDAQFGEEGGELFRPVPTAVSAEVRRERRVERTRNVPGPRIDRLDLTGVTLMRPSVEQNALTSKRGGLLGVEHGHPARV